MVSSGLATKSGPTLATLGTLARQAPQSMRFPRQEHWSGVPFPSPGDLPDPGGNQFLRPGQADSSPIEPPGMPPPQTRVGE